MIRSALVHAAEADDDPEALRDVLGELHHHLDVHVDVSDRVLYPMLRRAAGPDGEAAIALSRHDLLAARDELDDVLAGVAPRDALAEISELARHHVEDDEAEVFPLLRDLLDETHLEHLRDAFALAMKGHEP
jgi:hemerythrin-like domain-containing protein